MGTDPRVGRLARRLDTALAAAFADRDRVVLAFSGGLASLVVAALARKRGPLDCVVVGTRGAADVQAAVVARSFLDYRVEVLCPSPAAILRAARSLAAAHPSLSREDVLSMVPLTLVEERHGRDLVLSGFGLSPRSVPLHRLLAAARTLAPGLPAASHGSPPRRVLLRLAEELAIPDAFRLGPRRTPAEGSGVGPALRALGHARRASVDRLLRTED